MKASELHRRLARIEEALNTKRHRLTVIVAQIEEMGVGLAPLPDHVIEMCAAPKFMVVPPILGLNEWEALVAPYQDRMVSGARSDIQMTLAEQRPEGEVPTYLRQ